MSEHAATPAYGAIAASYARLGLRVFPLAPRSKVPLTPRGFKDATEDQATIAAWWREWPHANIGIATGEASGLFVVDVDGPAGESALAWLEADYGSLPLTAEVRTGKGRHLYFRHFPGARNTASTLGERIDTRGEGGYVVAPPSVHPDGHVYGWVEGRSPREKRRADAPEWLCKLLEKPTKAAEPSPSTWQPSNEREAAHARAYVMAALRREHDEVARAGEGTRNVRLSGAAYAMGGYVPHVTEREIEDALRSAAVASGVWAEDGEHRCVDTIRRGIAAGMDAPRPLPEPRQRPSARYQEPKAAEPSPSPSPAPQHPWKTPAQRALELGSQGERMPTGLPTIDEWTRGGLLGRRLVAIGGAPGAGKTALALQLAHTFFDRGHAVAVLAADEDADGLLMRWGQQGGLSREEMEKGNEDVRQRLSRYVSSDRLALVDADSEQHASLEEVAQWCAERAKLTALPGVLVVDSIQTAKVAAAEVLQPRERVDAVVVALKKARRLGDGLLVIATSEVSRGFYRGGGPDKTDPLAAFKESGGIEYGLDLAIVLDSIKGEHGAASVYLPKSRLGRADKHEPAFVADLDQAQALFTERAGSVATPASDGEEYDDTQEVEAAANELVRLILTSKGPIGTRRDLERASRKRTAIASKAVSLLLRDGRITGGRGVPFRVTSEGSEV